MPNFKTGQTVEVVSFGNEPSICREGIVIATWQFLTNYAENLYFDKDYSDIDEDHTLYAIWHIHIKELCWYYSCDFHEGLICSNTRRGRDFLLRHPDIITIIQKEYGINQRLNQFISFLMSNETPMEFVKVNDMMGRCANVDGS